MKWRGEWLLAVLFGCGDGVQQVEPVDCDPLSDVGCPAGTHCRILSEGERACLAPEETTDGCTAASCGAGEACVVIEGRFGCHAVCGALGEACGRAGQCAYPILGSAWSACIEPCELGGCEAGSTCAPVALPFPICVAAGTVGADAPCSEARCGAGLGCLLRDDIPRCTPLCRPGQHADCPAGQCVGVIRDLPSMQFCEE